MDTRLTRPQCDAARLYRHERIEGRQASGVYWLCGRRLGPQSAVIEIGFRDPMMRPRLINHGAPERPEGRAMYVNKTSVARFSKQAIADLTASRFRAS